MKAILHGHEEYDHIWSWYSANEISRNNEQIYHDNVWLLRNNSNEIAHVISVVGSYKIQIETPLIGWISKYVKRNVHDEMNLHLLPHSLMDQSLHKNVLPVHVIIQIFEIHYH